MEQKDWVEVGGGIALAVLSKIGLGKVRRARSRDHSAAIETLQSQYDSLQQAMLTLKRESNARLDRMEVELAEARKDIIETQVKSESATRHFTVIERALRELRILFESQMPPASELPRD